MPVVEVRESPRARAHLRRLRAAARAVQDADADIRFYMERLARRDNHPVDTAYYEQRLGESRVQRHFAAEHLQTVEDEL